jgi:zinc transport system substrate-binding protein
MRPAGWKPLRSPAAAAADSCASEPGHLSSRPLSNTESEAKATTFHLPRREWLVAVCILIWSLSGVSQATHRVLVATSIRPLADFVRQVGGNRVQVFTLVPPGASPHTYELTPRQVVRVANAHLLVLNGAGLEYWAHKLVTAAGSPALQVVDTSQGIPLLNGGPHGANPHIWLDVRQAMLQVRRVSDGLAKVDPAHAAEFEANTAAYLKQLEGLDAEIAAEVARWTHHQFIAFHPAWVYFARRYGLEQAAVIEKSPGREPSPAEVASIVQTAGRIGACAIFAEPQFSPKAAATIAEESGVRVVFLDPLGDSSQDQTYVDLMRYNVAQMASALR